VRDAEAGGIEGALCCIDYTGASQQCTHL